MAGWIEDTKETWHKLPTWGKWAVGLTVLAVVGIAIYELRKSQQNAGPNASSTPVDTGTSAGDTSAGSAGAVPVEATSPGLGTTADTGGTAPPAITPPSPGDVTQPPPMPTVAPNPIFTQFATPNDNPAAWTPQPMGGFSSQTGARAGCVSNCLSTSVHCKGSRRGSSECSSWCNGKCAARHP